MMNFHEVRFPASLSFGSVGGPERRTDVVTLANGFEERNTPWAHSRRRYDAGLGMRSLDDIEKLISFFEARRGQMYGFRWKDWSDFKSGRATVDTSFDDQIIGIGNGSTRDFELIKTYRSGDFSYERPISKPVSGSVRIGIEQDEMQEGVDFNVDLSTGVVSFDNAPSKTMRITAGFEFDVPVRFANDFLTVSIAAFNAGEVPNIPLMEIRV